MAKKRICVVITDKAQLSRLYTLLTELKRSRHFTLQVAVGGGALTYRYGNVIEELGREGFTPDVQIPTAIEGGEHLGMAKTAALGMLEFASAFENLKSEYVVVRGDRFEVLPVAAAAAYLNKVLVHLEGGDVSGSIDESVRHAITKLAHLHFVTNKQARERVVCLGERRDSVFNVGSLDVDYLTSVRRKKSVVRSLVNSHGVGATLDLSGDFLVVMQHPVTTEANEGRQQIEETLAAVHETGLPAVWVWPNLDAGSDAIAKRMREWQVEHDGSHQIRFIRYLVPDEFVQVLAGAAVVVGNSSTGIKECAWLGVPAVNIGTRQEGRLRADNVVDAGYSRNSIATQIKKQLKHGPYKSSRIYGNGSTAKSILKKLTDIEPVLQKRLTY